MTQVPAFFLIFGIFFFGMALLAIALSGYGSRDRSHETPHLPGHDVKNNRSHPHD